MARPLLIAFDFDHTIADDNSDIVIRRLLKNEQDLASIKGINNTSGWIIYMAMIFEFLHENGVTSRDIDNAISAIQPVNGLPYLLEKLHSRNVEIIIISDSNTIFINHWLKHHKLEHTIKRVFTNPAWYENTGLLKINMYHTQDWCKLSEKNMCKGHILENHVRIRAEEGVTFKKIAYVGDGKNDLCPILRLSADDLAFPRLNYPLMKIFNENSNETETLPKAEIIPWKDGTEVWREIIKRITDLDD